MSNTQTTAHPGKSKLWRPPIVGIITFVLMFFAIGLAHTMMVLIEHQLGQELTLKLSPLLGFAGIIMLWYGIKSKNENFQTWIGFFAGVIVWMCWVEFFYMWYGRENWGMLPRMDGLTVSGTWPEYMIMGSTVGTLLMICCFYTFDKDTRCNMFLWFQRKLGLQEGLGPSTKKARDRNYAIITFMETFFVTWFCYAWNLLCFDPGLVAEYRLLGFGNRDIRDEDFRIDAVDAGEIGAGHTVVALYEVELNEEAYGRRAPAFAEVSLRWEDADTGRIDEISGDVYADALATSFGRSEAEFQLAATVAAYAEVLRGSRYMRGISLEEIADVASELPLRELGPDADEFIELVKQAVRIEH